jgi:two-component system CheB/CheR fusion protein
MHCDRDIFYFIKNLPLKGESLLSLDIGLPIEQLREPIRTCLNGQVGQQELVLSATNRRGRAIQCRITINPLIGFDRGRQGVILLMEEIDS